MMFSNLVVLLPCHSLDDFPFHLEGADADGLLAAWSALWHPALVAAAGKAPSWQRVDSPPMEIAGWLIVVPEVAAGRLPVGYATHATETGATLIRSLRSREEILAAALAGGSQSSAPAGIDATPTGESVAAPLDPDLVADFLALGYCRLQVELLGRQRHYTSGLDEPAIERELVAAAQAAVAGEVEQARAGISRCYQFLAAGRQYFYPVDSYLVDLTLVAETTLGAGLEAELNQKEAINLLIAAPLLNELAERHPGTLEAIKRGQAGGSLSLLGGEQQEGLLPLWPLEKVLENLLAGASTFERLTERRLRVFGRRRYGLSPALPQILDKLGFQGALHVTLDDGRFPLRLQSKVRWQGDDTSTIDAIARLPRDAAQPQTFLELARRLGESMDTDHVATVVLAHWPGFTSPWYADLRRIARYTNALGRFVTLDEYFSQTYAPGEHARFLADEYRAPYLKQAVAVGQGNAISDIAQLHRRQASRAAVDAVTSLAQIAAGRWLPQGDASPADDARLHAASHQLAAALPRSTAPPVAGTLLVNPLSFSRNVVVRRPEVAGEAGTDGARSRLVELPPLGFAWVDWTAPAPRRGKRERPIAENLTLCNEFFELAIDPATGGVQSLYDFRHRANRISQQLALRTPGDNVLAARLGESQDQHAIYSQMRADAIDVTAAEADWGEITSRGQLVDAEGNRVAAFVQRTRAERGSRLVKISIQLETVREPGADPWHAYYAARFAWDSASADLWRSVHGGRHPTVAQQIEAPEFVEIDSPAGRTTILTHGLPYHRRSAPRVLDSLLIVRGETQRRFELAIGIDLPSPAAAAAECLTPPVELHDLASPLAGESSGWLFHVDARSALATHWQALGPSELDSAGQQASANAGPIGFRVRLLETQGQPVRVRLRTCRTVREARKVDFLGQNLGDLTIDQDSVACELAAHEWAQIEAFW